VLPRASTEPEGHLPTPHPILLVPHHTSWVKCPVMGEKPGLEKL
jgi:hypothetical protein